VDSLFQQTEIASQRILWSIDEGDRDLYLGASALLDEDQLLDDLAEFLLSHSQSVN
jgi:hypothetical protein